MAGSSSTWPSGKHLFKVILMVLVALVLFHSASSSSPRDFVPPGQQKREVPVDLLSQIGQSVQGTLDAWIGPETMHVVSEVRKVVPAVATRTEKNKGGDVVRGHPVLALHPLCHISGVERPKSHRMKQTVPAFVLRWFEFYSKALNSTRIVPLSLPLRARKTGK